MTAIVLKNRRRENWQIQEAMSHSGLTQTGQFSMQILGQLQMQINSGDVILL
jgi:preprotein translocase subunit SecD